MAHAMKPIIGEVYADKGDDGGIPVLTQQVDAPGFRTQPIRNTIAKGTDGSRYSQGIGTEVSQ